MNPTTPTPRTDDQIWTTEYQHELCDVVDMEFARKLERELAEKNNEASNWHQHYRDERDKAQKCKQAFIEQEKEVERLRELLNRAEHSASLWEMDAKRCSENADYWRERAEKAEAALAPSPEEPTSLGNEVARLREALKPFLKIANGIPENWPEQCILRFDQRNDGSLYVNYYGVQEASDGITIKQWRDLAQSPEKTNEVARLQAETDRLYIVAQEASESAQRKSNEVARLCELLNRAIEMLTAITWGDEGRDYNWQKVMKDLENLKAEARLAPAPEESPTTNKNTNTAFNKKMNPDTN